MATSGTASVGSDDCNDIPRYREREFNTLRFRAKFLFSEKIPMCLSALTEPYSPDSFSEFSVPPERCLDTARLTPSF